MLMCIMLLFTSCVRPVSNLDIPQFKPIAIEYETIKVTRGTIEDYTYFMHQPDHPRSPVLAEITYHCSNLSEYIDEIVVSPSSQVKKGDLLVILDGRKLLKQIRDQKIIVDISELDYRKYKQEYELTGGSLYEMKKSKLAYEYNLTIYNQLLEKKKSLKIYSKIDGIVSSTRLDGQFVYKNMSVVEVSDYDDLKVKVNISGKKQEGIIISIGDHMEVIDGKDKIDTVVESIQDGIWAYIVPTKKGVLVPNTRVNVRMLIYKKENVLLLPNEAVHKIGEEYFVYVLENNRPCEREVRVEYQSSTLTYISHGVFEGETVIKSIYN